MNTQLDHAIDYQARAQAPRKTLSKKVRDLMGRERRFLPDGTEVTGTRLHTEGAPIHRDRYHADRARSD
jgi:hypothetical protein